MNDCLFVYGSLLPRVPESRYRLLGETQALGKAYFTGTLFTLGHYPGAVYRPQEAGRVYGEVFRLEETVERLRMLDRYEGYIEADPSGCEFVREQIPVTLATGQKMQAWVYLYHLSVAGLTRIQSGDYLEWLGFKEA